MQAIGRQPNPPIRAPDGVPVHHERHQPVIEKILTHLGLQARAPPRTPARRSQLQAA